MPQSSHSHFYQYLNCKNLKVRGRTIGCSLIPMPRSLQGNIICSQTRNMVGKWHGRKVEQSESVKGRRRKGRLDHESV